MRRSNVQDCVRSMRSEIPDGSRISPTILRSICSESRARIVFDEPTYLAPVSTRMTYAPNVFGIVRSGPLRRARH